METLKPTLAKKIVQRKIEKDKYCAIIQKDEILIINTANATIGTGNPDVELIYGTQKEIVDELNKRKLELDDRNKKELGIYKEPKLEEIIDNIENEEKIIESRLPNGLKEL